MKRLSNQRINSRWPLLEGVACSLCQSLTAQQRANILEKLRTVIGFADLARHVYFSETGEPLPKERVSGRSPLLGVHYGRAVYLLYNGILKDKSVDGGNVLTSVTLKQLPPHYGTKVVYAAGSRFSKARLERERITFKQTPYSIRTR